MDNPVKRIALLLSSILSLYIIARAGIIPFVYDEIYTFLFHVQTGEMQPFHARMDANNHVLNSVLTHLSYLAFGKSLFALRLPNVLAFFLFLTYLFKSKRFFENGWVWLMLFVSLAMCHFLIDFFNLSRGYGLSMAFMLATIYHLVMFWLRTKPLDLVGVSVFLSLAVWSNLGLMVFSVAIVGCIVLSICINAFRNSWSIKTIVHFSILIGLLLAPLSYAAYYALALSSEGALSYGSNARFWDASVKSLVASISDNQFWGMPLVYCGLIMYLGSVILSFTKSISKPAVLLAQVLLWSTVCGTILLHVFLDVKYPVDRGTLHFLILFLFAFFLLVDNAPGFIRKTSVLIPIVMAGHFLSVVNLSHSQRWAGETLPLEFYKTIKEWQAQNGRIPLVSASIYQSTNLTFQDGLSSGNLKPNVVPEYPSNHADFVIHSPNLTLMDITELNTTDYDTAAYLPQIPQVLFVRKASPKATLLAEKTVSNLSAQTEYIDLTDLKFEKDQGFDAFRVDITINASSQQMPLRWWLVTRFDGKEGILGFGYTDLQLSADDIREKQTISVSHLVEQHVNEVDRIAVYIHNLRKNQIEIIDGHVSFYGIQ